ncbi:hypothetical protein HU200_055830 [Digitaria exilis]|uniref:Profilin n=1 Tax=Digitaria exilis TaxID=1010633 RepID=A0A835E6N9_9POAL|nr:hypothetical protein HU200_055830 [Digitaria exilis]
MSWQSYVDEHLLGDDVDGQRLTAAAILGLDGAVELEEITAIVNEFNELGGSLAPTGLYLGGSKYMVIQGEPGTIIRGKKSHVFDCLQGPGGVTIKKTNQAIIIGIYEEPMTLVQCNIIVERHGDYLIDQGV